MAAPKPKKAPKKRELDLSRVLNAVDHKNYDFYDKLTDAELKEFSPYVLLRFVSNTASSVDKDVQEWYIETTNELVNKHHWTLSKNHEKLLWLLYAAAGGAGKVYHPYLKGPKQEFNKIEKLLSELYPAMKMAEIKIMAGMMDDSDKDELFDKMGFDKKQRKEYQ